MPNMNRSEIVIAISHAATRIPDDIRSLMPQSDTMLLQEPDLHTDRIFTVEGPVIIQSRYSRIISDCNRAPDEMYT